MRKALYLILVILLVGDVATTTVALSLGAQEANPMMAGIVGSPITHLFLKLGFVAAVWFIATQTDRIRAGAGTCPVLAACLFYLMPVISNSLWIRAALGAG
jgi:hypothetical protein